MKEVYEKIYDITVENLKNQKDNIGFYKGTFVSLAGQNPSEVDLLKLIELNNNEFLEASYMAYFNRTPDKGAIEHWNKKINLDKETFQEQVTRTLVGSLEFRLKNSKVINNIYKDNNVLRVTIKESKQFNTVIHKLYLYYTIKLKPLKIKINKIKK